MNKTKHKIKKVLIANRGEIAVRIRTTLDKLGIKYAQIIAPVDRESYFARTAKELIEIKKEKPVDSYLSIPEIIKASKEAGCDAIHPGYGFLSENPGFVKELENQGITFIGPSADAMSKLGSKTSAREIAQTLGVPVCKGSKAGLSDKRLFEEAKKIGFPLLIKASAGGGGRGMRKVFVASEFKQALEQARSEALRYFKDDSVYIEQLILNPRHVEVQFCGDGKGGAIHLGTRDCSMQRRHQKLIEEAPAPGLSKELRDKLHQSACRLASFTKYSGVGTAEFLVSADKFFFLEVNTRLQVEHPVTEAITELDLVKLQLDMAMGDNLPKQKDIKFSGHAFEFRLIAEDSLNGFLPQQGKIDKLEASYLPHRFDFGFSEGDQINPYFDSLIGKVIHKAAVRKQALEEMIEILSTYKIEGLRSSLDIGPWLLENGVSSVRSIDIGFIERELSLEKARELRARMFKDPKRCLSIGLSKHKLKFNRKVFGAALMVSEYKYSSDKFKVTYTIEIQHARDGNFVAVPCINGKRADRRYCRRSNGLSAAIKSLIDDVLEKNSPTEILRA